MERIPLRDALWDINRLEELWDMNTIFHECMREGHEVSSYALRKLVRLPFYEVVFKFYPDDYKSMWE